MDDWINTAINENGIHTPQEHQPWLHEAGRMQRAVDLYRLVHLSLKDAKIDYKIRSQVKDAALSVSGNIAEGYGRRSINEYLQFLYVSKASLAVCFSRIVGLAASEEMGRDQFEEIDSLHYEVENKLLAMIKSLEGKREDGTWSDRIAEDHPDYKS